MLRELILLLISISALSCVNNSNNFSSEKNDHFYLYLSHTRTENNDSLHRSVYQLNFKHFEIKLLGGDLGYKTFNDNMLKKADSLFDLKNPQTLWSIGNHDHTTNEIFLDATLRNKYYTYVKNNITFIVLDSQDSLSSIVGKQREFLIQVLDTLNTKNIIIMSHKLIYMDQHPILDKLINDTCNGIKGNCFYCHNTNNFQKEIYPKLLEVKNKGKNIIWIGGDLGMKKTQFEFVDENEIIFLGNGMESNRKNNDLLLIYNDEKDIHYKFIPIETIIKNQESIDLLRNLFLETKN